MATISKQLERLPTMFVKECGYIPIVLTNAAAIIEKNLKTKDLFQTQGLPARVNHTLAQLSANRVNRVKNASVHDVIEAMKMFLVRLPEPLLPENICDELIKVSPGDTKANYSTILSDFRQTMPHNFAIIHFMMRLLKKVGEQAEHNGMDVRKLATIFVLDVINPLKIEQPGHDAFLVERMQRLPYLIMVVENMIHYVEIFSEINQIKGAVSPPRASGNQTPIMSLVRHPSSGSVEIHQGDSLASHPIVDKRSLSSHSNLQVHAENTPHEAHRGQKSKNALRERADGPKSERGSVYDAGKTSIASERREMGIQVTRCDSNVKQSPVTRSMAGKHLRRMSKSPSLRAKSATSRKRKSSSNKSEVHLSTEKKPPKSVDKKMILRPKPLSVSHEGKGKRKSRSVNKIYQVEHFGNASFRSQSRESEYSVFQRDEDMTPWNDVASVSDDTSVMAKTIRNPRVLSDETERRAGPEAVQATDNDKPDLSKRIKTPFAKYSHDCHPLSMLDRLRPSRFFEVSDSSHSDTSTTRVTPQPPVRPPNNDRWEAFVSHCFTFRKNKAVQLTPQSTDTGQDEVNCEETKTEPEKTTENEEEDPTPVKGEEDGAHKICRPAASVCTFLSCKKTIFPKERSTAMSGTTVSMNSTPFGSQMGSQVGSQIGSQMSGEDTSQALSRRQHRIKVTVNDIRPSVAAKHRHLLSRVTQFNMPPQPTVHADRVLGEWLVDIVLVFITLLCTCLVFYIHQYNKPSNGWNSD
ncbi:unnamed protein product [Lymnaea stagnalis]|uniref:Rho-GAP domain-containing protein n=1 Tax=Lymnaea stagnalis TaxID=6523 RepID=A0AAV2INT8_LYMST